MSELKEVLELDSAELREMPILDQAQVELLQSASGDGGASLFRELLDLFVSENRPHLEKLSAAIAAGTREGILLHAHAIAGSAANLGGLRLSGLCRSVEATIKSDRDGDFAAAFEVIRVEFETLVREIEKLAD